MHRGDRQVAGERHHHHAFAVRRNVDQHHGVRPCAVGVLGVAGAHVGVGPGAGVHADDQEVLIAVLASGIDDVARVRVERADGVQAAVFRGAPLPSAAGQGQRQHGEQCRQRARGQQDRATAAFGLGRRVLVGVVVGVVGGLEVAEVGKLRDELERVGRGVDDLGVLQVDGHVRRDGSYGVDIGLVGLIGCAVMAVPVGCRGADFGDQVGDTDRAVGVTSDPFRVSGSRRAARPAGGGGCHRAMAQKTAPRERARANDQEWRRARRHSCLSGLRKVSSNAHAEVSVVRAHASLPGGTRRTCSPRAAE